MPCILSLVTMQLVKYILSQLVRVFIVCRVVYTVFCFFREKTSKIYTYLQKHSTLLIVQWCTLFYMIIILG